MSTPDAHIVHKLLQTTPTDRLHVMLKHLNRTRKKHLDYFHVNGTRYVTTRRFARDLVKSELTARTTS